MTAHRTTENTMPDYFDVFGRNGLRKISDLDERFLTNWSAADPERPETAARFVTASFSTTPAAPRVPLARVGLIGYFGVGCFIRLAGNSAYQELHVQTSEPFSSEIQVRQCTIFICTGRISKWNFHSRSCR
jgi:hypothetical protein